jgi:hypothetical protein
MKRVKDIYDSERSVEIPFTCGAIIAHGKKTELF